VVKLREVKPLSAGVLEELGMAWHTDGDGSAYIANEIVQVTHDEANAYYEAGNTLYEMYVQAAQHVIENDLFFEIGIPFNLVDTIKKSWENDVHWHLYGRFDLAGGIDGTPIKLIEFNADTPTGVFETAILQWALLKHNGMEDAQQFNNLYEALKDNFKRFVMLFEDIEQFDSYYAGWKILFSSIEGNNEEEATTRLLQTIADEAGFATNFAFLDEVQFSPEGIFDRDDTQYEYWFKLFAWEDLATDEPELVMLLDQIIQNQKGDYRQSSLYIALPKQRDAQNFVRPFPRFALSTRDLVCAFEGQKAGAKAYVRSRGCQYRYPRCQWRDTPQCRWTLCASQEYLPSLRYLPTR